MDAKERRVSGFADVYNLPFSVVLYLWLWVVEPTVESLFCLQLQKTNEKKAAPITAPFGFPLLNLVNKAAAELANNAQTSSRKTPY